MTGDAAARDADLLLVGGALPPGGRVADVRISDGRISAISDHLSGEAAPSQTLEVLDISGRVLLPAAVETHTHLDRALLRGPGWNPAAGLAGAVEACNRLLPSITAADIRDRALQALGVAVRRGHTVVRSHTSLGEQIGLTAVTALLDVARDVAAQVELELVGMVGCPLTGRPGGTNRTYLQRALEMGIAAVGGAPGMDDNPHEAVRWLVATAADAGRPIDLHIDETLSPHDQTLTTFAREVDRHGLGGRAVASHCVSLGQHDEATVAEVGAMLAGTGICVVALPQTNLLLQGADRRTRIPRGIAPVRALREAGVSTLAGGDNWRDMFNPLGRIDPLETAALLSATAQITPTEAYESVSSQARHAFGRPAAEPRVGAAAELLAVRARSVDEAVADASEERTVIHNGRVVADTHLTNTVSWPHTPA